MKSFFDAMINDHVLISVITICKNSEKTIEDTLVSVQGQSIFGNEQVEHIIIDGGSTDQTLTIIKSYTNIHVTSELDQGISDAFNKGVQRAKGKWLLFLNADDWLVDGDALEKCLGKLEKTKAMIVYGKINYVDRDTKKIRYKLGKKINNKSMMYQMKIQHPACFFRRKYFEKYGLYDKSFKIAMDYEILLRGLSHERYEFMNETITNMRDGGLSPRSQFWKAPRERIRAQLKNNIPVYVVLVSTLYVTGKRWSFIIAKKIGLTYLMRVLRVRK